MNVMETATTESLRPTIRVRYQSKFDRLREWMDQKSSGTYEMNKYNPETTPVALGLNRIQEFAMLTAKNGFSSIVTGWGSFHGRFGLEQNQAIFLMAFVNFYEGMCFALNYDNDTLNYFDARMQIELMKLSEKFNHKYVPQEWVVLEDENNDAN
jgi:hypothetical protein